MEPVSGNGLIIGPPLEEETAGLDGGRDVINILGRHTAGKEAVAPVANHIDEPIDFRACNGPEFVSLAILQWIADSGIQTALNDPDKPWQNGADESFNGKLRDECLSLEWFRSRKEAAVIIEAWRRHYNAVRPHSSLKCLTILEFKQHNQPITNRAVLLESMV